jgi:hypothetical protein
VRGVHPSDLSISGARGRGLGFGQLRPEPRPPFTEQIAEQSAPGPYIISVLHPLRATLSSRDHFLFQDLSSPTITDDLAYAWVQQFRSQGLKQAFWEPSLMTSFVLTMRDEVGALAVQIPDAKQGLAMWIRWIAPEKH